MAEQIIRQPDSKFAVFSTMADDFVVLDATPLEIVEWRVKQAARAAEESAVREIAAVMSQQGVRPAPYYQFTLTWEQAVEKAGHDPMGDGVPKEEDQ